MNLDLVIEEDHSRGLDLPYDERPDCVPLAHAQRLEMTRDLYESKAASRLWVPDGSRNDDVPNATLWSGSGDWRS